MIVYFSGTGNSRYAAEVLAHQLGDEVLDSGEHIKAGEYGKLESQNPWIFVAPTYAWRLPRIFEDYIQQSEFSGSREAYFVLTCGSDIGNAGEGARALCEKKGLHYRGILEVVMPENYIAMFPVPNEQESAEIIEKAIPVLVKVGERIKQGKSFSAAKPRAFDALKSGLVNDVFYRVFVKASSFYVKDNCTGCSLCVKSCPLNNIQLKQGLPVWGKDCTHCMACICGCPVHAVEYGKISRGKRRYQCPAYRNNL